MPDLDSSFVMAVLLLATRLGAAFAFAPPMAGSMIPRPVRLCIVLALAFALATLASPPRDVQQVGRFVVAMMSEAALGALLGLGLMVGFSIPSVAARVVDLQMGFGMSQVLDPMTRQNMPVVGALFQMLAVAAFFCADLHHTMFRGLALSVEHFPPGGSWLLDLSERLVVHHAARIFSLGLAMVSPIVTGLLMVELALALTSRSLPQINMLALGVPVKIVFGLMALSSWSLTGPSVLARAYHTVFESWGELLR